MQREKRWTGMTLNKQLFREIFFIIYRELGHTSYIIKEHGSWDVERNQIKSTTRHIESQITQQETRDSRRRWGDDPTSEEINEKLSSPGCGNLLLWCFCVSSSLPCFPALTVFSPCSIFQAMLDCHMTRGEFLQGTARDVIMNDDRFTFCFSPGEPSPVG